MSSFVSCVASAASLAILVSCQPGARTSSASNDIAEDGPFTVVIAHARLYTDAAPPNADAVALRGTKIAAIGASNDLGARCTDACTVVDARGGFLQPGFHDAHVHLFIAGQEGYELVIAGTNVAHITDELRAYAAEHDDPWILGRGWNSAGFAQLPTRATLDAVESRRPVVLTDHTGHNVWTNSAALAAAGITRDTPDPQGGKIIHDAAGEPTGMFLDNAQSLILAKRPALTEDQRADYILAGQKKSLAVGCTSMQGGPVPLQVAQTYARLDREGKLRQRAFLWAPLLVGDVAFGKWLAFIKTLPTDGKVQVVAFKGLADGTFATRTSALLAPYADDPTTSGELYIPQPELDAKVIRANQAGFPVAIHATGDRAVRSALDAFERSKAALGHRLVNRIEHAVLVDPADAKRFAPLGVAASVQPVWVLGYASSTQFAVGARVGPARLGSVYPWNTLARAGATLLFGSDLPSSDLYDPVMGIHGAVDRVFANGEPFTAQERVDADLALRAYTATPAAAIGRGDSLGKLAVGYEADLVLLDHDPRTGAKSLADDPIRQVWVAGSALP